MACEPPDTVQAICIVSTHNEDYFWNLRFSFLSYEKKIFRSGEKSMKKLKILRSVRGIGEEADLNNETHTHTLSGN